MDEFHNRENWPFVTERDVSPEPIAPVPPKLTPENGTRWSDDSDEEDSEHEIRQDGEDVGASRFKSEIDVSPVQSSTSSFEETYGIYESGDVEVSESPDEGHSHEDVDSLYEDIDDERDIPTHMPSSGMNGSIEPSNPIESTARNGSSTPIANTQTRPSSIIKSTPSSKTMPRRTPSITAQIPLNRQRVRYSWQSVQDEEPNRPRIHVIKLVSNTATASAGFPQGEAFGFSISPCGRRIAAYNSSRLYILQSQALPVGISQDYALKRRPVAVEVVDDGNTLAILADQHTVNVYDLDHQLLRRIKTIKLDFPTHCIAMSSTGALLAAGYEGGVEIFSLDPNALPTDRRAVRSQKMDRLIFSKDGSTLVGTTTRINVSSTVVISVPVFPTSQTGVPTHEELKEAWCSELLNPENIRNSSHANFMRENRETCNDRLFAWNGLQDTFGILKIPDMMYSNLDFPVVIDPPLSTLGGLGAAIHSCPDVDEHGNTVAMVVNDRTIRLYLVPKNVENNESIVEAHSIDHELDEGYGCPFSDIRWVQSGTSLPTPIDNVKHVRGRLIVTSPGAVVEPDMSEEMFEVEDLEGGRIVMFDFDPQYIGQAGQTFSLTLGNCPPQLLEEPALDVAHEVAIVRRRTVNQSRSGTLNQRPVPLGRSATSSGNRVDKTHRSGAPSATASSVRRSMILLSPEATRSLPDLVETNEALEPIDEPYAQNAPRSQASLQRAASNAQRHRFQTLEEKNQEHASVESSGNFLPLPEYTEEPNAPLPSRFRVMAGLDAPAGPSSTKPSVVTATNGDRISPASSTPTSPPTPLAENLRTEQAFAAATGATRTAQARQQSREGTPTTPPASSGASVTFNTKTRPGTSDSIPPMTRSDTFQSLRPMNPRFIQRAYANAAGNPLATGAPPRWNPEGARDISYAPPDRPFAMRQASLPVDRMPRSLDSTPQQEPWDAISPLPSSSPSSPALPRPPPVGLQYRFSTSQLNPPGHSAPMHAANVSPSRAPSSAGSYAPSSISSPAPSYRDMRLPPHMLAFRNAAAANAAASLFPPTQESNQIPIRASPKPANTSGYTITGWHPPAPSSTTPTGHVRKTSISNKSAFASTTKAKNLGFFRRGTKKNPNLLFGPEFASKQPGATSSPPGTGKSDDSGAKSVVDAKSLFTIKTKIIANKCTLM